MKSLRHLLLQVGRLTALVLVISAVSLANDQTILVSIYTDNPGMVTPEGRRLYAVVTESGDMIYALNTRKGILNRKRQLTTIELLGLREVLHSSQLSALRGPQFDDTCSHGDYQIRVLVTIARDSTRQEFTMAGYDEAAGRFSFHREETALLR